MTTSPALEARGVTKSFGGVPVLRDVDFAVARGSIHGLVGENGAGKSTLISLFAGLNVAETGELLIDGKRTTAHTPRDAHRRGLAFLYQQLHLVPDLTVAEDLLLTTGYPLTRTGRIDRPKATAIATEYLELVGVDADPRTPVRELRPAQRQLLAFARVLLQKPEVIFLDEPTASLGDADSRRMTALLRDQARQGVTLIYVSHRLDDVLDLCDTITVLRDGRLVETRPRAGLTRPELVAALGGIPDDAAPAATASAVDVGDHPVRLELRDVVAAGAPAPVSLTVRAGEVLGIAGLVGSGRSHLARLLAGHGKVLSGEILLDGAPTAQRGFRSALAQGIVLVPESRADALVQEFDVAQNISLGHVDRYTRAGLAVDRKRERRAARTHVERLSIKLPRGKTDRGVGRMSGGNQQKVLLARALDLDPRVLVLDEPTAGIDIGAKQSIYRLVRELADQGVGVVFISSELEEVSLVSDRIIVWSGGRAKEELAGGASRAAIVARLFAEEVVA